MRPSLVETDRTARRDVPMSPMSGDTAGDRLMALILTETDADSDTIDAIVTELRNVEAEARQAERSAIRAVVLGWYMTSDDVRGEQVRPLLDYLDR